jgi:hypothetical protein
VGGLAALATKPPKAATEVTLYDGRYGTHFQSTIPPAQRPTVYPASTKSLVVDRLWRRRGLGYADGGGLEDSLMLGGSHWMISGAGRARFNEGGTNLTLGR